MIILHGPDGSELYLTKDVIVAFHTCLKAEQMPHAATTIYLSNGMEWHVQETVAQITTHLGK